MKSLKTFFLSLFVFLFIHSSFAQGTVTAVCVSGLDVSLLKYQNTIQATIQGKDCNKSSFSSVSPANQLVFRINRLYDLDRNGVIDELDHLTAIPDEEALTFNCANLNEDIKVQMWVMDGEGNTDYCICPIALNDYNGYCQDCQEPLVICAETIRGEFVPDILPSLKAGNWNPTLYPYTGCWSDRCQVPKEMDEDYIFSVSKESDNIRSGISTYDLVLISKHILNVEPLDSPYKILAADMNQSETITTLDLLLMRKLILRIDDPSTQGALSWRFIPADFEFPNPENPWETPIPNEIIRNGIDLGLSEFYAIFIGIKMGDVN